VTVILTEISRARTNHLAVKKKQGQRITVWISPTLRTDQDKQTFTNHQILRQKIVVQQFTPSSFAFVFGRKMGILVLACANQNSGYHRLFMRKQLLNLYPAHSFHRLKYVEYITSQILVVFSV
jgi:hypothetical protein